MKLVALPVSRILDSVAVALPVFDTVTVMGALVWPTVVVGKVSEVAESVMVGVPGAVPVVVVLPPLPQPVRRAESAREKAATAIDLRSIQDPISRSMKRSCDYKPRK